MVERNVKKLTPGKNVIDNHSSIDIVHLHNEEVEKNSLDQHPTESCHKEEKHQGSYCNTYTLRIEKYLGF